MEQKTENVYQMISKVASRIAASGLGKTEKNKTQGWKFRGIDQVYNALAPIMSEVGLVMLPRVLSRCVIEKQSRQGSVLFYVTVECEFDFVSSQDGSRHTVKTFGEAMDSGDKATNKAMSAAYKYACFQSFCIPTIGDNDADSTTHEVVSQTQQPKQQPQQAAKFDQQGYDQAMSAIAKAEDMRELKGHYDAAINLYPQMTNEIKAAAGDRRKQLESMVAA